MPDRRGFLAGLLAASACPRAGWADAGNPAFLTAGMTADGAYLLCGLSAEGAIKFSIPIPDRGHAAAAHPHYAEAVAFARRPGRFALVIDCAHGLETARLEAPAGRHFYGHGAFSADGALLFTTENDFEAAQGVVGVWDVLGGYSRVGEFASGGIGPHDIKLMPDGETLVVANGGIETHPEMGRAKLNIPVMQPSLTYLGLKGEVQEQVTLAPELHKNSIRHLAVSSDGAVAFAMQWQGEATEAPPLLGVHRRGTGPARLALAEQSRRMQGYVGSIALSDRRGTCCVTSPRGGVLYEVDLTTLDPLRESDIADVCGIAATAGGYMLTSGDGVVAGDQVPAGSRHALRWDNHLIPV